MAQIKKKMINEEKLKKVIESIVFQDISNKFPKEYLSIEYEPLYAIKRILDRHCVCYLDEHYKEDEQLISCLDNLFIDRTIEEKKNLYFTDFSGITCTKANELRSFEDFKQEQYERSKEDSKYSDYETVKYEVFNTVNCADSNPLEAAKILTWSNKIYADTRNKSHRFTLLCKLNDLENRNDSYSFRVTEYSINEKAKKYFLENYYGFIIKADSVNEIVQAYADNSLMKWDFYRPYWNVVYDDVVVFIVRKENDCSIPLLKSENVICINTLLDR